MSRRPRVGKASEAQSTLFALPATAEFGWEIGDVERQLSAGNERLVIGVDEAGRGPLAGPVVVAAVVFEVTDTDWAAGLTDSKQLSSLQRDEWFTAIASRLPHHVVVVGPREIDELNILRATLRGMRAAVDALVATSGASRVLVDGNQRIPEILLQQTTLVKGDSRSLAIAAASVLAKVTRDRIMIELDALHPEYGFAAHKGYGTSAHLAALREHGPSAHHRFSYAPVREAAALRENAD